MRTILIISGCLLIILAVGFPGSAGSAPTAEKPRQGADDLLQSYHRHSSGLAANSFGIPLVVESFEQDDRVHVDVYGIFDHPFSGVVKTLRVPANWCDIVALFPNVKACTSRELQASWLLTFYLGRKVYQSPEDARRIIFNLPNTDRQHDYLDITLHADEGPYGTRNHRIRVKGLPLDRSRTFIHVSYTYSDSSALRLATRIYFATLGRDKVGFSVTGTDSSGAPVYIGGPRGAVERNAVRCFFAIQSVMDSMRHPEESRFSMRTSEWFDLTARYRRQLSDLDKQDYLEYKTAEQRNQRILQGQIKP
ncbi:MAG: hypothetical protein IPQ16_03655 [Geobacteraceae bacterium]|nr:hypothetical protein [Geobacteraceae bacterium]